MSADPTIAGRLRALRGFLVDMDGVIYRGSQAIPGAAHALASLQRHGPVLMLTNNSTKEPGSLALQLTRLGFDLPSERIIIVTEIARDHLLRRHRLDRILVLGEDHVAMSLRAAGLAVVDAREWRQASVVLSACSRTMDHALLGAGLNALMAGAVFLCTNCDLTVDGDAGRQLEAGAYARLLAGLCGREPTYLGKPEATCFAYALGRLGTRADETAMIGDNLDTDIRGARDNGLFGALVLSGLTAEASPLADISVPDIGAFAAMVDDSKRE
ncbi:MAG: HAD-IIA family hydrolase [Planctomycetes bacterium]|nr:HAD-IIA family hydrolase [Planctomycetota bacterium]